MFDSVCLWVSSHGNWKHMDQKLLVEEHITKIKKIELFYGRTISLVVKLLTNNSNVQCAEWGS